MFDIPPIAVRVAEHQLIGRRCGCGVVTAGSAPEGVSAPVQYGPRVAAIMVYVCVGQFLSKKRTAAAWAELFGTPVSAGTVAAMTERAAGGLGGFTELVRGRIADADVAHFDETGLRVQDTLRWVHSASTGRYTLIIVHDHRGTKAMNAAGVLPDFAGVACHDAGAPSDTYPKVTPRAVPRPRPPRAASGHRPGPAGAVVLATPAADALREMNVLVSYTPADDGEQVTGPGPDALADAIDRYRAAVTIGAHETRARSGKLEKKHPALARRLTDRQDDYLRFTTDPRVPFDNYAAERETRMVKLRQKVSGCLRTLTGAAQFCAIRSYLATAAKHGINFFDALVTLAQGRPWMPAAA